MQHGKENSAINNFFIVLEINIKYNKERKMKMQQAIRMMFLLLRLDM